jgi:16S rRNA (cytosine1402-N4)-methyltransferase
MNEDKFHKSVLVREIIEALNLKKGAKVIDATLGTGGHTSEMVKEGYRVLGIDLDPLMLKLTEERHLKNCILVEGNFKDIDKIALEYGFGKVAAVLFDLGVSNLHLKSIERGFSFSNPEAFLDMRLNKEDQGVSGADLLNVLRKDQLEELFSRILDYRNTKEITKRVMEFRESGKITTVGDFLEICKAIRGKNGLSQATLPFLALRIAVNSELENLKEALPKAFALLEKKGRLLVITFHSGEERILLDFIEEVEKANLGKNLTEQPIRPNAEELNENPRSRSAKLRILEKHD